MPFSNRSSSPTPSDQTPARQSARSVVAQHQRKARSGLFMRWTIVAVTVAIIAVISVVVVFTERDSVPETGSTPSSGNSHGGIALASPRELVDAPRADIETLGVLSSTNLPLDPQGVQPETGQEAVEVVAWVDVNCVHCANFEATFGDQIEEWLANGVITMEYRTVAYLDRNSTTDYSSRAAAASACVADASPQAYLSFMEALFTNYSNGELSDDQLGDLALESGAEDISTCVDDKTYRPWVSYGTELAQQSGIQGTPTIYVDGTPLVNPADFVSAVDQARAAR
jgi:protein-disulfide isomerase